MYPHHTHHIATSDLAAADDLPTRWAQRMRCRSFTHHAVFSVFWAGVVALLFFGLGFGRHPDQPATPTRTTTATTNGNVGAAGGVQWCEPPEAPLPSSPLR